LVLRHEPDVIGIELDESGWVGVTDLIDGVKRKFSEFDGTLLDQVVAENDKKRFEFDITGTKIRACQGHSIDVDLGLENLEPPESLFHGTTTSALTPILKEGISKRLRHAVHLSVDTKTATKVGSRHGTPVILEIMARKMYTDGFAFQRSTNGVWLTDEVPPAYIKHAIYPTKTP
jgi:putative RNA 2'-phosphotransferase